jgi:hypothetical protein
MNPDAPLGLIAGQGRFPFLVAEGARKAGRELVIVGLRGQASSELAQFASVFRRAGVAKLGRWIRILRRRGVHEAILAGRVRKTRIYTPFRNLRYLPDLTSLRVWYRHTTDKKNDTLLSAVAAQMAGCGIVLQNSVAYCMEHIAHRGCMTRLQLTPKQLGDAQFGWRLAKELGRLDIGQAIAVKERDVIAVEAIEGTDEMIRRAGHLCPSGGWTLVKVAKPDQDMRFDVPTIGPDTIRGLRRAGAKGLIVEAERTLIVDKQETLDLSDHLGVAVVGMSDEDASPS